MQDESYNQLNAGVMRLKRNQVTTPSNGVTSVLNMSSFEPTVFSGGHLVLNNEEGVRRSLINNGGDIKLPSLRKIKRD